MITTIFRILGFSFAVVAALWALWAIGRAFLDVVSCLVVAWDLRDEYRKDVYERTGVLPGREQKERKAK